MPAMLCSKTSFDLRQCNAIEDVIVENVCLSSVVKESVVGEYVALATKLQVSCMW